MNVRLPAAVLTMSVAALGLCPAAAAAPSLELYGNFHAMGVVVTLGAADDPDANATATVDYRVTGTPTWQRGYPPSRVGATRLVGSLFWLTPGTSYDVRVSFADPGGALDGSTVSGTHTTRADIVVPAPSRTLHVAPAGSGTQCTSASPCGLADAISSATPGDHVVLRGGTYYEGEFAIPRSGTASAPIVIRSAPGERAILDGADPGAFQWSSLGGGVYRTSLRAADPHVVIAGGQRLFPYQSADELRSLRWGVPGFRASGTSLDVHLAGGADPASMTMVIARYNNAFYVEQNFVYFVDLTFRHYGGQDYAKAIYFLDGSDGLVQGCTFAGNDVGVGLKYDSHRTVIQDNEFSDTIAGWPWDAVKEVGNIEDGGVYVYEPMTGRGTVIRRNTFHDDFDALHVNPEEGTTTRETDVYENLVYAMIDDGIEVDGYSSNVRVWGNTFRDVLMGVSVAPVYAGPTYVLRNLVTRTGHNGREGGSGVKFNSGYDTSGPIFLFHNTVDAVTSGQDGLYIAAPGSWTLLVSRNNVLVGTRFALTNENPEQPVDLDYDALHTSGTEGLAWWEGVGGELPTLGDLRSVTGQELHGVAGPPGFTDAATGDYTPREGSPLIDRGVVLPGINTGFNGAGPDIGAFERGAVVAVDRDNDSLPDEWESRFGLSPAVGSGPDGADGDPDGDGVRNRDEYLRSTHPRGIFTRYFAEGATSQFFDCRLAILNPSASAAAAVLVRFQKSDGSEATSFVTVGARRRVTVRANTVDTLASAEFSTVIESDVAVVVDRRMSWDADAYGTHAEISVPGAATSWYLAEGATHSGFQLFYLVQNPGDGAARVTVTYLLASGPPVVRTYTVDARSRFNIWVNDEARRASALANAEMSAQVTSDRPVIVERAMYRDAGGLIFGAGHESAGILAPATSWFFAEGATGEFFDLFLLVANPADEDAVLEIDYLLPAGGTITRTHTVTRRSRATIWVDGEDPALADTAVSSVVRSTNGVAIVAERAMWWPYGIESWHEAHNSPGATATATRWAVADGESSGPPRNAATYVLVANTSAAPATIDVTTCFEDAAPLQRTYVLAPRSRFNVDVNAMIPEAAGRRFGVIVESTGAAPAPIVVERAIYWDAAGVPWAAGGNALATRLP
jgi:hypothetical protein